MHTCRLPPASQGSHLEPAGESKADPSQAQIASLQQQLAEAKAINKKLGAIVEHQQSTIESLQVGAWP